MNVDPIGLIFIVAAMAVESCAQLFLKVGASGGAAILTPGVGRIATRWLPVGATRIWIAMGVAAYVLEIVLYTSALRLVDVGIAFPLGSLCFVGVAFLSWLLLGERVGRTRWLGIGLILAGVCLVTR